MISITKAIRLNRIATQKATANSVCSLMNEVK